MLFPPYILYFIFSHVLSFFLFIKKKNPIGMGPIHKKYKANQNTKTQASE
jgi:hypothetical protein